MVKGDSERATVSQSVSQSVSQLVSQSVSQSVSQLQRWFPTHSLTVTHSSSFIHSVTPRTHTLTLTLTHSHSLIFIFSFLFLDFMAIAHLTVNVFEYTVLFSPFQTNVRLPCSPLKTGGAVF